FSIIFFFQAEDGIRDFHVTGVQTCALPISTSCGILPVAASQVVNVRAAAAERARVLAPAPVSARAPSQERSAVTSSSAGAIRSKIGRASCRVRVAKSAVGETLKKERAT